MDDNVQFEETVGRRHREGGGVMTTVEANRVTLGVEHFGDAAAPLALLAGGNLRLSGITASNTNPIATVR